MKFNAAQPRHWLYLASFTATVVCAIALRWLRIARPGNHCLLYGHKLNGNLKALADFNAQQPESSMNMVFLTMDSPYARELEAAGYPILNGTDIRSAWQVASAFAVVSDHGLHSLSLLQRATSMPFLDVWHAIPLKGFDGDDFRTQQRFQRVFVTSELVRDVYINTFDFPPDIVRATGYARTDMLVEQSRDVAGIKHDLGIHDPDSKLFLFAPTWQQDDPTRDIFPFGVSMDAFFTALQGVCERTGSLCIFRTHLNSGEACLDDYESILFRPHSRYPDTEEILLATDCLVSDWSSIVFDYLLLDRPTIFLDVPHPFKKGFSISPDNRFGKRVGDLDALCASLESYLLQPETYAREFAEQHRQTRQRLYDHNADGHAARRICDELSAIMPSA